MPTYKYPRPSVTVDIAVFGTGKDGLRLLLVQRGSAPHRGKWALPGGFVHIRESLEDAAARELREETGIEVSHLEQLYTFGDPGRDPRGRVVSVAYLALVRSSDHEARASSDAAEAAWFAVDELPDLAFDHARIVETAIQRLRAKVRYAPIGFDLLPEEFTLSDLQHLYEILLQRALDKRNFRKRMLGMDLLVNTGRKAKTVPPARTYRFDKDAYRRLTQLGFNFEV